MGCSNSKPKISDVYPSNNSQDLVNQIFKPVKVKQKTNPDLTDQNKFIMEKLNDLGNTLNDLKQQIKVLEDNNFT